MRTHGARNEADIDSSGIDIKLEHRNFFNEINNIGIEAVSAKLKMTSNTLSKKLENPNLFTLNDLNIMQVDFGFTDIMIKNYLKKYY